jgi:hypothetical protein
MKISLIILTLYLLSGAYMTSEKENEHFPWDIGDLTDDE